MVGTDWPDDAVTMATEGTPGFVPGPAATHYTASPARGAR